MRGKRLKRGMVYKRGMIKGTVQRVGKEDEQEVMRNNDTNGNDEQELKPLLSTSLF